MKGPAKRSPSVRFLEKIEVLEGGCWKYLGAIKDNGYGVFSDGNRKQVYAHRFSFEAANGTIPFGLVIDHLCRNRWCVNPAHLEAVTQLVNLERGENKNFVRRANKICKRGHFQDKNNTLLRPDGRRYCKLCRQIRRRKSYVDAGVESIIK